MRTVGGSFGAATATAILAADRAREARRCRPRAPTPRRSRSPAWRACSRSPPRASCRRPANAGRAVRAGPCWVTLSRRPDGSAVIASRRPWKARATRSACDLASSARSPSNSESTVSRQSTSQRSKWPGAQPHLHVQLGVRAERAAAVGLGAEQDRLPERGDLRHVRLDVELGDVGEDPADDRVRQRALVERAHEALAVCPVCDVRHAIHDVSGGGLRALDERIARLYPKGFRTCNAQAEVGRDDRIRRGRPRRARGDSRRRTRTTSIYSAEFENGKIVKLRPDAARQGGVRARRAQAEDVKEDHAAAGGQDPARAAGPARRRRRPAQAGRDRRQLPRPADGPGRSRCRCSTRIAESPRNKELLEQIRGHDRRHQGPPRRALQAARRPSSSSSAARCSNTYWLIQGAHVSLPLEAVKRQLADSDEVDVPRARRRRRQAARRRQPGQRPGSTPARRSSPTRTSTSARRRAGSACSTPACARPTSLFNSPDHIAIAHDLTGDGDPCDQCDHGTASAGEITGNARLGNNWRGVSAISRRLVGRLRQRLPRRLGAHRRGLPGRPSAGWTR